MKKLNKHPRLYKKMANTLKKLITNRIKLSRPKMLTGQQNKGANNSIKNQGNNNYFQEPQIPPNNKLHKNINNNQNDFSRIINVASFRKIPYNDFILRLTPYDYETYLKMIKMNYSCRLEIHLTNIRPMKFILEVLLEKWKNIPKIEPKINLYLIPIRELWIPKELIFFSINDCDRIYDIGDIYTAYGSPSTNILHMKYQWNEDKVNLISNLNNLNQYNNSFNNTLLAQQNDSMLLSESNVNNNNNLGNKLKLSASNLLNASHRTFINNNHINFNSNRAIKGEESQDMFDLSDLDINNSLNNENEEESDDKKNINITESLNKNDAYNNILDKLSDQDSMFPLDTELLDPMELLGFDGDKKFDNLSNSTSNKIKTNSKGKKNHLNLRHKKISFVNNIKPTGSMINSSFANKNKNNNNNSNLKLRTGYSEVFSNNNSNVNNNNVNNNLNNLAYTSNNNLSEVSSHINNSNHYMNFNSEIGKQISNNKSPVFNIGNNNSEKKEIKNIYSILNNNSNLEEDSKLKLRNLTDPNNAETKQNLINNDLNLNQNQNSSIRKKKKLKFVNNVSKENIQEIKQNSLSIFDKPEIKTTKNLSLTPNFSFGQKPKQEISKEEINKSSEKNEKKEPNNININTNNNNINNQSMNWNLGINNGFTRLLGNNSNIFGLNDTNPFIGNNTLNYNSFYENTNLFKSNLNNSNLFKIEHTRHLNDVNQLSQMSYINRAEERNINNSFIGNDNNTLINENNMNNNTEEINNNNYKEEKEKEKENDKEFIGKKRKNEEKNQKKEKKNNNAKNNNKEKKSKKNSNTNSENTLKTPSFNYNNINDINYNNINQTQNRINNLKMGFRGINNPNYNYNMNNNINNYQNFPYNIDIPLPSKFFEESVNNFKK